MLKLAVVVCVLAVASFALAGVVSPVDNCGGDGIPLQLRVTDCEGAPPCHLTPSRPVTIEGDFIASANSNGLSFRLTIVVEGHEFVGWDSEIPNSGVSQGLQYTIAYTLTPEPDSSGLVAYLKIEVYDTDSSRVELCFGADAIVN